MLLAYFETSNAPQEYIDLASVVRLCNDEITGEVQQMRRNECRLTNDPASRVLPSALTGFWRAGARGRSTAARVHRERVSRGFSLDTSPVFPTIIRLPIHLSLSLSLCFSYLPPDLTRPRESYSSSDLTTNRRCRRRSRWIFVFSRPGKGGEKR